MSPAWRSRRPVRQAGWGQRSGTVLCWDAKKHHDLLGGSWRSGRLGGFITAYFGQEWGDLLDWKWRLRYLSLWEEQRKRFAFPEKQPPRRFRP
jgi:hypothetical protein